MKWPESVTIIRHGESAYNALKALKNADPLYAEFKRAHSRRAKDPELARALVDKLLEVGTFILGVSDRDTPLTERGQQQAEVTGAKLKDRIRLPDVILVSPYKRTHQTLGHMAVGWPELGDVKQIEDERLREQEHGIATIYSDWRIFEILHPEQEKLRRQNGAYWYRYPQGESVPDVRERLRSLNNKITRDYAGLDVMMISHHLTKLGYRANMEELDEHGFIDLNKNNKPINCGVTIYKGYPDLGKDGKLILDIYNEKFY